jgi:hypothetical protein
VLCVNSFERKRQCSHEVDTGGAYMLLSWRSLTNWPGSPAGAARPLSVGHDKRRGGPSLNSAFQLSHPQFKFT